MRNIGATVTDLLGQLDQASQPFDMDLARSRWAALRQGKSEPSDEDQLVIEAELAAVSFTPGYQDEESGWGTYYGPQFVLRNAEGAWVEWPSISAVTADFLAYWQRRSEQTPNPVLKARYADLVWDLSHRATSARSGVGAAHSLIDASLEAVGGGWYPHVIDAIDVLQRALSVALSISDTARIDAVRDLLVNLEDGMAVDEMLGTWGFCFDALMGRSKVPVTEALQDKLVGDLEARLERLTHSAESWVEPHHVEHAVTRLVQHYRRTNETDKVKSVLERYGSFALAWSHSAAAFVAAVWLQRVYEFCCQHGYRQEAGGIAQALERVAKDATQNMAEFSHEIEIPRAALEEYIERLTSGSLTSAFARLTQGFLLTRDEVARRVREMAETAPLAALFPIRLSDEEGRALSLIGSVRDDLDGRVVHQMSQDMAVMSPMLRFAVSRLKDRYSLTTEDVMSFLRESPAFSSDGDVVLSAGIAAYLNEAHVESIHVLVVRLEDAVRRLTRLVGGAVYKPGPPGSLDVASLETLLRDGSLINALGEDIAHYLRVLLTDRRGWNIRNAVCHGLLPDHAFGPMIADRLFHALLLLGLLREQSTNVEATQ